MFRVGQIWGRMTDLAAEQRTGVAYGDNRGRRLENIVQPSDGAIGTAIPTVLRAWNQWFNQRRLSFAPVGA